MREGKMIETLTPFKDGKYIPVEEALKQVGAYQPKQVETKPEDNVFMHVPTKTLFLKLENIVCVGSNGLPFEAYKTIYVATDIVRGRDAEQGYFGTYRGISYFENAAKKMFLPSIALTCNILAALYANRSDPEFKKVLDQYKDNGKNHVYHIQNTIVNWENETIIHYPSDADFPNDGGNNHVNPSRRAQLPFKHETLTFQRIEEALNDNAYTNFIKNLTGIQDPTILLEIGRYFQCEPYVRVLDPYKMIITASTILGCSSRGGRFDLCADMRLRDVAIARGVWNP
jgi:hypothetical protein